MRASLLAILSLMLMPGSALAQQRSAQPQTTTPGSKAAGTAGDPIVVTARPAPDRKEVSALARAVTPRVPEGEPLLRFSDPICIGSAGLDRPTLLYIGDRMARDAQQAGLELAGDGCKPNILVLFVDDVDRQLAQLVKRRWSIFGDRTPSEIRDIAHEPGPVRAWNNSEIRSRDGDRIEPNGNLRVYVSSRLVSAVRRDTLASIVLVERAAVLGKTPNQLGDYMAMRALAVVRPQAASGKDTILTLFDPKSTSVPAEMTAFDRGYLRGLYAGAPNLFASTQQNQIVRAVMKDQAAEDVHGQ